MKHPNLQNKKSVIETKKDLYTNRENLAGT